LAVSTHKLYYDLDIGCNLLRQNAITGQIIDHSIDND